MNEAATTQQVLANSQETQGPKTNPNPKKVEPKGTALVLGHFGSSELTSPKTSINPLINLWQKLTESLNDDMRSYSCVGGANPHWQAPSRRLLRVTHTHTHFTNDHSEITS